MSNNHLSDDESDGDSDNLEEEPNEEQKGHSPQVGSSNVGRRGSLSSRFKGGMKRVFGRTKRKSTGIESQSKKSH